MPKAKKLPSGNWRCQVFSHSVIRDGKKKNVYKSFTAKTKKEAEYLAATYKMEHDSNDKADNITIESALNQYIDSRESVLSPKTIKEYRNLAKNNLQTIKHIKVCDITQHDIQHAINMDATRIAPKTVRNVHGLLSATLKEFCPGLVLHTSLPKKKKPELYIPTEKEIKLLLDYVKDTDMEIPVMLAAFGPMRRGEICALTTNDIEGNTIHVTKSLALNSANEWVVKAPKTRAGIRDIEMPDFVISKIKGKKGRIVEMTPAAVSERFRKLIRKMPETNVYRFHDLRHYCASFLHYKGIPDKAIMQRAGWETDGVLRNVYLHMLSDEDANLQKKVNDMFSDIYG